MLLKLLIVFAGCKGLLCNAEITASAGLYLNHEPDNNQPEIINHELVYEVKSGENIEIDCLASGSSVVYKWSRKAGDIVNTNRFTVFAENGTMRVASVEDADHGVYTCVASNNFGSSEKNFAFNVLSPPSIAEFNNITIVENTEGILTCKATGRPAPFVTFNWYGFEFTDSEYRPFRDIILSQTVNEELGETIATLNFTIALRLYYGEYGCSAKNSIDSVKQLAYVTIEYPPDFAFMDKPTPFYSYGRRPVHLSCKARALPGATIVWYWNDKLINELDGQSFEVVNNGSESTLVVEPIDDSYFTTYKCVASNKIGEAERIMELREAYPPEAVADVLARSWSIDAIGFEITASLTGTPAEFYRYQYKEESERDWIDSVNFTRAVKAVTWVHVEGLKPNTKYNFRFYAENELGTSPFVELSHQTMCEYMYAEPKILNEITEDRAYGEAEFMESPYPDRFELIWEPIIEPCEEIIYYSISYCLGSSFDWKSLSVYEGQCTYVNGITSNNYTIGNLTAETYYGIRLTGLYTSSFRFMRTARDPITGGDRRLKIYPTYSVQNIAVGTTFNLTCKSKVESVTNLSWHDSFNNPINSTWSDRIMYTEVVNDAELMLVIPFMKHAMAGTYYCASLGGTETIETFVNINTYILVSGSEQFEYNYGFSGHTGYLSCRFYDNDDNTTIEWMFENNRIEASDRYELRTQPYTNFYPDYYLIIQNLTQSDEGFYTCRQSANERRIYYEVLLIPSISNNETEYFAVEGNDFVIDCETVGMPAPNVRWTSQNGTDVTLNRRFSVNRSGQMQITRVEKEDEGGYTCAARSLAGTAEKTVRLKVEFQGS